jgi:hypothetical protein
MAARKFSNEFAVAFSFAGEQRDFVRAIAEAVEARLGPSTVFFDEWFEHYIAGNDADLTLQAIYGDRCALAVVCVSGHYGDKPWTRAEHEVIRVRQMKARGSADQRDRLGILPIRVGDGDVPGILFNTIVPDVRKRAASETAELIVNRLDELRQQPIEPRPLAPAQAPNRVPDLVAQMRGIVIDSPSQPQTVLNSMREACEGLSYQKLGKARLALRKLRDLSGKGSGALREEIICELKEFLLDLDESPWRVIPPKVRALRRSVVEVIRTAASGKLNRFFMHGEFEGADLYGANFGGEELAEVSFQGCFLVTANFSTADLTNSSFSSADIRNADFSGAILSGVDFAEADWFNAVGFTKEQISGVRRDTLLRCPTDAGAMHRELKSRYSLSFYDWSEHIQ